MNRLFLIFSFLLATFIMVAQPSKQEKLEQQKAQLQKEIAAFKNLYNQEKKKKNRQLISCLNKKLAFG